MDFIKEKNLNRELFTTNSILNIVIFLLIIFIFIISKFDFFWAGNVDLAAHVSLVSAFMEHFGLISSDVQYLGYMVFYPPDAHILSAVIGVFANSPIIGVQVVTLVSLVGIWCAIGFAARTLPSEIAVVQGVVLLILFLLNDKFVHLEVFGQEIVSNFFFGHFVAQAISFAVISISVFMDTRNVAARGRYTFLAFAAPAIEGFHLLPALEIFGFLAVNIATDLISAPPRSRYRLGASGAAAIAISAALLVLHPVFGVMSKIAENDGSLPLIYTPNISDLVLLAIIVGAICFLLLCLWMFFIYDDQHRRSWSYFRAVAAFGFVVSALCLAQFVALQFGFGSPYAVKKYAFGLNTTLLLLVSLGIGRIVVLVAQRWMRQFDAVWRNAAWIVIFAIPIVLMIAPSFSSANSPLSVSRLVQVERFARAYRAISLGDPSPQHDYVIGVTGILSTGDYMISLMTLKAPIDANASAILQGNPPATPESIRYVITSLGQSFWDAPDCRRFKTAIGLAVVDGQCVLANAHAECKGTFDFSANGGLSPYMINGFAPAEARGRWAVGPAASFTCDLSKLNHPPKTLTVRATAFVPNAITQHVSLSIGGMHLGDFKYDHNHPASAVKIMIPEAAIAAKLLRVEFSFPDAVSPSEVGLSSDSRKLSLNFQSISFDDDE